MRPLKPQGRTEPALTRADLPRDAAADPRFAPEPVLTRAAAPVRSAPGAASGQGRPASGYAADYASPGYAPDYAASGYAPSDYAPPSPAQSDYAPFASASSDGTSSGYGRDAFGSAAQVSPRAPVVPVQGSGAAPRFAGLSAPAGRAAPRYEDVLPAADSAVAVAAPAFSGLYKAAPPVRREPALTGPQMMRAQAAVPAATAPQPPVAPSSAAMSSAAAFASAQSPVASPAAVSARPQEQMADGPALAPAAAPVSAAPVAGATRRRLGIPLSWLGGGSRKPVLSRAQPAVASDGVQPAGVAAPVPGHSHQAALNWVSQGAGPSPELGLQPDPGAYEVADTLQPYTPVPAAAPSAAFDGGMFDPEDDVSGLEAFAAAPAQSYPAGAGIAARRAAAAAPVQPAPVYGEFSPESLIAAPPVRRPATAESEHWSPVLPGHAAQPAQRPGRGFSPAAEPAGRPWKADYSFSLSAPAQVQDPAGLPPPLAEGSGEDDEDVPFRPWVDPDPRAGLRPSAVPASTGSAILPAERLVARPVAAPTDAWGAVDPAPLWPADTPSQPLAGLAPDPGALRPASVRAASAYAPASAAPLPPSAAAAPGPWMADAGDAASAARSDEPGWDRFYTDSDPGLRPSAPQTGAASEAVPEAPMFEAPPSRRDMARRDPAPSRTAYRLQRMWLTPFYRALLRKGLPAFAMVFACGLVLQDQQRREAIVAWAGDLRASVAERPEFMLSELKVEGASGETADAVLRALALPMPVSSFDLDLPVLQQQVETIPAVASAALHVRSGGVLEVAVQERQPVVVWRSDTGIGTLDATGHQVAHLANRLERPDLPLVVGAGAETAVPEALRLYQAAGPIRDRLRGLIRVGERRWDLIVEPSVRIMLPAADPVPALEQVVALHQAQALLDRDITAVDLRNPARATVRMGDAAAETWRLNLAAQKGK